MNVTNCFIKIKNNQYINDFIKEKFNIEIIGIRTLIFFLSGDLKKLNFNFKLKSNLKNLICKNRLFRHCKRKIISNHFFKSEISLLEGNIYHYKIYF